MQLESPIGIAGVWTPGAVASHAGRGRARPFAEVRVETDVSRVAEIWAELETAVPCSVYQTRRWLLPCIETKAFPSVTPVFVVGYGADGRATALLPLGLSRKAGQRIAHFLGGAHANVNMGLFRPEKSWTRSDARTFLMAAARASRVRIDCFVLANQPPAWNGHANPLAHLPRQPSPDSGHVGPLQADAKALVERSLSADARKKLRKKLRRLVVHKGAVRHVRARDEPTARVILSAFRRQKLPRLRANGICTDFDEPGVRAFIEHAATARVAETEPAIELHALYAGESIVATFGGGGHQGRFSGMFNSFEADDIDVARSSPGDLLLMEIVKAKCAEGYTSFDLGIGSARYKEAFCGHAEPMFDVIVPVTPAGRVLGALESLKRRAIGTIKRRPWLRAVANQARKTLNGLRHRA